MAIITISRGSYSHGKEIAEKVAGILGYECVSREILIEASKYFKVPEMKLLKSIHDAPSILDSLPELDDPAFATLVGDRTGAGQGLQRSRAGKADPVIAKLAQ